MIKIELHDTGAAVEDVQQRLAALGYLREEQVTGTYGEVTANAVRAFCQKEGIPEVDCVDDKVWAALVDAGFHLGDRTLYLRMPYFHGNDVVELQRALGALGFACGAEDGIFGAYTELALRKFQMNMGLFSDGIAGAEMQVQPSVPQRVELGVEKHLPAAGDKGRRAGERGEAEGGQGAGYAPRAEEPFEAAAGEPAGPHPAAQHQQHRAAGDQRGRQAGQQ